MEESYYRKPQRQENLLLHNAITGGDNHILNVMNMNSNTILNRIGTDGRDSSIAHANINTNLCHAEESLRHEICDYSQNVGKEHTLLGNKIGDSEMRLLNAVRSEGKANSIDIYKTGCDVKKNVYNLTKTIIDNDVNFLNTIRDSVERTGDLKLKDVTESLNDIKNAIERNGKNNQHSTETLALQNLRAITNNFSQNSEQAEMIASEERQYINMIDNNITLSSKDLGFELCKTEDHLADQASKNFSAIELENLRNIQELECQLSECCCEIKEQKTEQSCATKQLVQKTTCDFRESLTVQSNKTNLTLRKTETDRLRGLLAETRNNNIISEIYRNNHEDSCEDHCNSPVLPIIH